MITVVFYAVGASIEQYIQAVKVSGVSQQNVPNGLIFHSCSSLQEGFLVVDVWESKRHFEDFGAILRPALEQAGLAGIEPKIHHTHYIMGSCAIPEMDYAKLHLLD